MSSKRYFDNPYPDYTAEEAGKLFINGEIKKDSKLSIKLPQKWCDTLEIFNKGLDYSDSSVYTGTSGIALLKFKKDPDDKQNLKEIEQLLCLHKLKRRRHTFLCGDAGPLAIGAVVESKLGNNDKCKELIEGLISMQEDVLETMSSDLPNEYLYGRAGYLFAVLFVNNNLSPPPIKESFICKIIEAILLCGKNEAAAGKFKCPLMYQWHESYYLGAAHGLSGILYLLLQAKNYLTETELNTLVKPTIDYLSTLSLLLDNSEILSDTSAANIDRSEAGSSSNNINVEVPGRKRKRYIGDFDDSDVVHDGPISGIKRYRNVVNRVRARKNKQMKFLQQNKRRLTRKIQNLTSLLKHLTDQQMLSEEVALTLKDSMPPSTKLLFKQMLKSRKESAYPAELKSFALTLNFYSPKAYDYVRGSFHNALPHPRTIQKWYHSIECEPGFHSESLKVLKAKVAEMRVNGKNCICGLMVDEMSIHRKIEWNGEKFVGFSSGNYPSSLGREHDKYVQWCHGAPGFVFLYSLAYKVFGEPNYLQWALEAGDVIWERGLVRKGYSICHGVAGNAYCFLELYQTTKDEKHLYRAIRFAEWCLDYKSDHEEHKPDRPLSLFEGISGPMYFLLDIQNPAEAKFPGFTL